MALERIEDALLSGNIRQFIDWSADQMGLDPLKTTDAQILEAATKELFLSDLSEIAGGRLNQLIERNLLKALTNAGKISGS